MQFCMSNAPLPADAEVAVLVGLHQTMLAPYKLVYVFRRWKCVHVYECVTHAREYWYSLHLTTDHRFTYREMQPSARARCTQFADWWLHGSGTAYPAKIDKKVYCDLDGQSSNSVLIVRDPQHPNNISGGREVLIPSRYHCFQSV